MQVQSSESAQAERISNLLRPQVKEKYAFRDIVIAARDVLALQPELLFSRKQDNRRTLVYWVVRKYLRMSYPWIGMRLDRDHTTVLHGCRLVDATLAFHETTPDWPDPATAFWKLKYMKLRSGRV